MNYVSHEDFLKHTEQDSKEFTDAKNERAEILRQILQRLDEIDQKLNPDSAAYILKDVNEHMSEVKPFLQAYSGLRITGEVAKWIAGVIIAIIGIVMLIKGVVKP